MLKTAIVLGLLMLTTNDAHIKEPLDVEITKDGIKYDVEEGWLSAYDLEPSEGTYEYRLSIGDIEPGYDVYLAVSDCSRMSETGLIFFDNSTVETYQVFDCAKRNNEDGTKTWMEQYNIIAEIDYNSWQRHGKLGKAILVSDDELYGK